MKIGIWVLSISILMIFISCSKDELKLYQGVCVAEYNKMYVGESLNQIYKVIEKNPKEIKVGLYNNKSWSHQENKPLEYFTETKAFRYSNMTCPDEVSVEGATMNDRVKAINLNMNKGK
jgi:hypothetical protein